MPTVQIRPLVERVLEPATGEPLPKEGKRVELSSYWRRRLAAREVELVEEPAPKPERAPKPKREE